MASKYVVNADKVSVYNATSNGTIIGELLKGVSFTALPTSGYYRITAFDDAYTSYGEFIGRYVLAYDNNIIESVISSESTSIFCEYNSNEVVYTSELATIYKYSGSAPANNASFNESKLSEIGDIEVGTKLTVKLYTSDGKYVVIKSADDPSLVGRIIRNEVLMYSPTEQQLKTLNEKSKAAEDALKDFKVSIENMNNFYFESDSGEVNKGKANDYLVSNLVGIHGAPYQFLPSVDCRVFTGSKVSQASFANDAKAMASFGRKYSEKIASRMPLTLITPGEPDFLPSYSRKSAATIVTDLVAGATNLKDILNKTGRYYSFKFNYTDYYKYVNTILRQCAIYLGIGDVKHVQSNGKQVKLKSFEWDKAVNSSLTGFASSKEYVAFYADAQTSSQDSITNNTTSSSFAGAFDNATALAREVQFLAGPIAGIKMDAMDKSGFDSTLQDIKGIVNNMTGSSKFFNNLTEAFSTIGQGARLIFPEIWDDSNFDKPSMTLDMKLRCPNPDKVSWYLDILVPTIHAFCLAMPRSMGANSYRAPFLVRVFHPGLYSCDMGIITSMNINKGREGAWTDDHLPTEVDISITIRDLYETMAMSMGSWSANDMSGIGEFLTNTALMDYLANTCGININKPDMERIVENYLILMKNATTDAFTNKWRDVQNDISQFSLQMYNLLRGGAL